MDGPGFHVDLDRLEETASGVRATVTAQSGAPLRDLARDGSAFGHPRLDDAVRGFCARWSAGIDLLVDDGVTIGASLARAVTAYRTADLAAAHALDPGSADPGTSAVGRG